VSAIAPASTAALPGRRRALGLSWLAYATYYLGRKSFSVVKSSLSRELGFSTGTLAAIDTVYLVAYACGQVPSGLVADRWGARRLVATGMLLSALACLVFGVSNAAWAFALCFAVNGIAQATGWPGTTKIVAQWTTPRDRGRVMGVWSTCYQVGGIAATALATFALGRFGWRYAFFVPAAGLGLVALFVVWGIPREHTQSRAQLERPAWTELRAVLRLPILYSYGACYFCIKLIRYSLLFWLPFYLHTAHGFDEVESGYLSTAFEVGGVLGCVAVGYVSDRSVRSRAAVAAVSLIGLAFAVFAYAAVSSQSAFWHFAALALIGALLFGPDALLSGAAAQDAGGTEAAATATGLVNALGSAGALLQGVVTAGVQRAFGWHGVLHVFVGLSLLASLCLIPATAHAQARKASDG
jgi:OPA family sugar phosphate sensor protein UhpC-like MFS transporter